MGAKPPKSWKEAVVKYLKERQHKPSYDTIVQRLSWWSPHLKHIHDIKSITRDMIDSILSKHRNVTALPSPANTTANKYAGSVGAVMTAACREWGWNGEPLQDYGAGWYKARSRAELADFPWHGFRHTFASWLGQNGCPETALDQLCGWAEKDTRSIYTHLNVETLRPYAEIIDSLLGTKSAQASKMLVSATA